MDAETRRQLVTTAEALEQLQRQVQQLAARIEDLEGRFTTHQRLEH